MELITQNKDLVNILLVEYPGLLRGHQVLRDPSLTPPRYTFRDLDEIVLRHFLRQQPSETLSGMSLVN